LNNQITQILTNLALIPIVDFVFSADSAGLPVIYIIVPHEALHFLSMKILNVVYLLMHY